MSLESFFRRQAIRGFRWSMARAAFPWRFGGGLGYAETPEELGYRIGREVGDEAAQWGWSMEKARAVARRRAERALGRPKGWLDKGDSARARPVAVARLGGLRDGATLGWRR